MLFFFNFLNSRVFVVLTCIVNKGDMNWFPVIVYLSVFNKDTWNSYWDLRAIYTVNIDTNKDDFVIKMSKALMLTVFLYSYYLCIEQVRSIIMKLKQSLLINFLTARADHAHTYVNNSQFCCYPYRDSFS